jgi:hypothetical protein
MTRSASAARSRGERGVRTRLGTYVGAEKKKGRSSGFPLCERDAPLPANPTNRRSFPVPPRPVPFRLVLRNPTARWRVRRHLPAIQDKKRGWLMGRKPTPDDLIFPRQDGKHRLVSGTYKAFKGNRPAMDVLLPRRSTQPASDGLTWFSWSGEPSL